jgi:DNA replication protein DnaC
MQSSWCSIALGYLPCDSRAAEILYNIISRRHEQRSTIISTNLAFKQWGTTFPGAACVVALVDRFAPALPSRRDPRRVLA